MPQERRTMENQKKPIGERLKDIRKSKGLTQVEMAIKLGLAPHYYNSIECGKSNPGLKTLRKFAELTKTPIKDLI